MKNNTFIPTPLFTNKGSKIFYSNRHGIGKQIGSRIYVCREEAERIVPEEVWCNAIDIIHAKTILDFNSLNGVCYDLKKPNEVRFDTIPFLWTEREPVVGRMYRVNTVKDTITALDTPEIIHHKWLWVNPNKCVAFDVEESYNWSKLWLSKFNETASGYFDKWNEQLRKYNLK